jgi:nucleoside-diphosphate-sugar epimerase
VVEPCQAILHAAASLTMRWDAPEISRTNCLGTQQALMLGRHWGVEHFTYISSVPVIGRPFQHPITEQHPVRPFTAYHASKLYGEHLVECARRDGLPGAVLRITAPVGAGMPRDRIVAVFVERAIRNLPIEINGKGTRQQNYVDVRDVAAAVIACMQRQIVGVFNIGGEKTVSNCELAARCIREAGSTSPVVFTGRPDPEDDVVWDVALDKARDAFGYRPRWTVDDTIRALAAAQQP